MDKRLFNFSVQVYGELKTHNETVSIGRCRIFYKGLNRNGSFITDEFAEKLLRTLPYTPVKGIYSNEKSDYTKHGKVNSEGRIYGVVPENPNVTWEEHFDEDGVTRTYACCDVLIYTALYKEAGEILEKPESMELYPPSIKGDWIMIQGQKAYSFTDGCFFGLQVLGDEVEPCFEGAAFFTLNDKVERAFEKLKALESTFAKNEKGGNVDMHGINFKLSEGNELYMELFALLNPNFNEEGNWEMSCALCAVTDEYALIRNYETGTFEKVKYAKKEEEICPDCGKPIAECECGEKKDTKKYELLERSEYNIIEVSEAERNSLDAVKALNNDSFEKIEEVFSKVPDFENRITDFENKISEYEHNLEEKESEFTTLKSEKEELDSKFSLTQTELETANQTISALNAEIEGLKNYKLSIETSKKQAVIDKYAAQLDAEIISKYSAEAEITIEELEKNLAFELVKVTPSLFAKQDEEGYVPNDVPPTGLEAILNKYKK